MPKRQLVKRIPSDKAQGRGSWVEFVPLSYGKRLELRDEAARHEEDESSEWIKEQERQLYSDHIANWNWVDEHDVPLPLPKDDPTVIDGLLDDEIEFLSSLFAPAADRKK